ncbi:alpha/beta hydrolase [Staphylococcus equorum]|uniref:Alpha/beta hydrolase n=1 Tax=Staphylococcus equorum TaxID=246432 RepID=A0A9X4L996_9STAP|nr:alpha/beta hydrolase [Staphylococcus equorum]MDG0842287.1 alpha/beta hydrolase [Staphylococcus equorum]MDG0858579.1 alpha/beta hydrolase [Staphylococcus equorum]
MDILRKKLSEDKKENAMDSMKLLAKLPGPVLEYFIRFNLKTFRKSMENQDQKLLNYSNPNHKETYKIYGWKNLILLNVYRNNSNSGDKKPLFYFIHGGAFIGGSSYVNDNFMRALADRTGYLIASVDYTLSPEAKYPEGLNDCYKGLNYLLKYADDFKIDTTQISIGGDSAGGNLAASLILKLAKEKIKVQNQILYYPLTDFISLDKPSYKQQGAAFQGMKKLVYAIRHLYLKNKKERSLPFVSPLRANIPTEMPKTLIIVAEKDGLRSDGIEYAELLEKSGHDVSCLLYENTYHAFINDLGYSVEADDALDETIRFITN